MNVKVCSLTSKALSSISIVLFVLGISSLAFAQGPGGTGTVDDPRCDVCIGTCNGMQPPCTGTCVVDSQRDPPQCGQNVFPVYTCTCKPLAGGCGCD
jgi:hypothetical protein